MGASFVESRAVDAGADVDGVEQYPGESNIKVTYSRESTTSSVDPRSDCIVTNHHDQQLDPHSSLPYPPRLATAGGRCPYST